MGGFLLGNLIVFYVLILPIVLLVDITRLRRRIDNIEKIIEKEPIIRKKTIESVVGPFENQEPAKTEPVLQEKHPVNWEIELGRKYFYWIGIFIFLVGVALFLKYAFENKWFNEVIRIIIGIVSGTLFMYAGNRLINKYRQFSLGLFGIGIVIFYLSFFTANNFYHIIPYSISFFMMILITALCVVLTLAYDSIFLAFIALIGGFLTPCILGGPEISMLTAFFGLSSYLLLLNAGFLTINIFKPWRILPVFAMLFTYGLFYFWIYDFYNAQFFAGVISCISIFFFVYLVFILSRLGSRHSVKPLDFFMTVVNIFAYSGFVFYLVNSIAPDLKGISAVILAFILTFAVFVYRKKEYRDENIILLLLGASLILLTIAFPLYLKNTYITISWICEALLIFWLGLRVPSTFMRIFGYIVFILSICRFLGFDTHPQWTIYTLFNERFITGMCIVICLFLSSALSIKRMNILPEKEKRFPGLLAGIANILIFIILTIEVHDACRSIIRSRYIEQMILSISWALYAGILLSIGMIFKVKMARYFALIFLGLSILKVMFLDLFSAGKVYRIIVSIVTGAILIIVGFVYHRKKEI